mmetsp:Transcript_123457/g.308518  ORF Transcript_123457/g.308518 Transcript_123457/m.308518 type:complete len:203 (-) Transcript_123457:55-663(-)|eukprot:CAMPEP_0115625522 /NCGR_PEP_ID=MMETSP0272-20121206/27856_1 /TAXON_ID=71861 /ORGANISM="Scrippsiella trochoidea, Strain CCMP3099" /LENGTH=202 /DNA_ID=CAMNT_0003061817 /DNA_START=130 /DNA_END=738 /DNA_ORIENTATION=+
MSDLHHGFDKHYAHRHVPFKWHSSSGFTHYPASPLAHTSLRDQHLPAWREELAPQDTSYVERPQDSRCNMSAYGVHRENPWHGSLRSPRNPFPGQRTGNREARYVGEILVNDRWTPRDRRLGPAKLSQTLSLRSRQRQQQERHRGLVPQSARKSAASRRYDEDSDENDDDEDDDDALQSSLDAVRRRYAADDSGLILRGHVT